VRVVLVVHNVLQVDARLGAQVQEELLVKDERNAGPLLHLGLLGRLEVDKVGRDADGKAASELFALEACRFISELFSLIVIVMEKSNCNCKY